MSDFKVVSLLNPQVVLTAGPAISAGTQSQNTGTVIFSNSNGVTFGLSNGTLTASAAGGAGGGIAAAAGTQTQTSGTLAFVNSNGITFGMSNSSQLTASHNGLTLQTVQPVAVSGSNGSLAFSTLSLGGSNGLSFYSTNGSIVGSYTVPSTAGLISAVNVSAGTTSGNVSALTFNNGNGVSFGYNGGTITASVAAPPAAQTGISGIANSETTYTSGSVTFRDLNGVSWQSTTGQQLQITHALQYTSATSNITSNALHTSASRVINIVAATNNAAGGTASLSSNVSFSAANGLTFYTSAGNAVVGSYTAPVVSNAIQSVGSATGSGTNTSRFAADDHVHAGVFSMGVSTGGNTVGDTRVDVGRFVFAGGNNITLSMATAANGLNTITISGPNAGGAQTGISGIIVSNTTYTSGTVSFSNANGISFGSSAGQAITASYTVPTVPAQFSGGNSNLGNTAGDTGVVTGRLVLVGTNNITLSGSTNGGSITISISGGAGAAGNTGYISAGTTNASLGTVSFLNANGVSFGVDGQTLTASVATSLTNIRVSAGTTSNLLSALTFADGNGVSFGINASTITATVRTDYLTSQSNQALSGSNGSFTFQTATFGNSNGLTFYTTNGSMVGSYTVPTQSNQTVGGYFIGNTTGQSSSSTWDARTISFDGAGIVSIGASAGSIRISATQSNQAFSADASSTFQTLTLQNSNGISFSNNAGAIRLTHDLQFTSNTSAITSAALHTSVGGRIYVTAQSTGQSSSSSYDLRTLSIVPDGIISAGWSNGSFRISATQSNQAFSAGAASSTFQTLSFQDSNGISFSNNAGAIRASYTRNVVSNAIQSVGSATGSGTNTSRFAADDHVHAGVFSMGVSTGGNTAGDTRVDVGRFVLQGGNNITLSQVTAANALNTIVVSAGAGGGNTNMTAYATGNTTQSSTGTIAFSSYIFRGSNNVSVGVSNGSVVIDATQSNPAVSNSAGSFTFQTLNFSNANNVTWGTSAGGIVTASVAAPGAAAENNWMHALGANTAGNTTASGSTIGLSGINLTISGTNASVFNLSVPATSSLSATGQVSISTNGSTISIGVPNHVTLSGFDPFENQELLAFGGGQGTLWMQPLDVMAPVQFDNFGLRVTLSNATNSSGSLTVSVWAGIYTRNASTLSLASSTSFTRGATMSGTVGSYSQYAGMKILTGAWTVTMPHGNYWMGLISRTTTGGANMTIGNLGISQVASTFSGFFGVGSATSNYRRLGAGIYSATTSAMPGSINFNAIQGGSSAFNRPPAYLLMSNTY